MWTAQMSPSIDFSKLQHILALFLQKHWEIRYKNDRLECVPLNTFIQICTLTKKRWLIRYPRGRYAVCKGDNSIWKNHSVHSFAGQLSTCPSSRTCRSHKRKRILGEPTCAGASSPPVSGGLSRLKRCRVGASRPSQRLDSSPPPVKLDFSSAVPMETSKWAAINLQVDKSHKVV